MDLDEYLTELGYERVEQNLNITYVCENTHACNVEDGCEHRIFHEPHGCLEVSCNETESEYCCIQVISTNHQKTISNKPKSRCERMKRLIDVEP